MKPIVIAAPSANCGKTTLVCHWLAEQPMQALKITRFHRESHCPVHGVDDHGDDNCDGCAPAPDGFQLIDAPEILGHEGKDTARMMDSGATKVRWLRAAPHVFEYALGRAMREFDGGAPLLIEGNSAATLADFDATVIVLWPRTTRGVKESVLPALCRMDVLLMEEDENGECSSTPSFDAAMRKAGTNKMPKVVWLKSGWHRSEGLELPTLTEML